jgi:tRNA(Ile)-lysidine synthase
MKKKQVSTAMLLARFEADLRDKRSLRPRQRILVACSGGPDSVALFHLLQRLALKYSWKLGLIHFNHQLRPQAGKQDEDFVRKLARKHKVDFFRGTGNVEREAKATKTSIEEAARKMRYDFFLRVSKMKRFPVIVLAHTRDDQAETVLMRVLQGTGLRGLQGIREKFRMGRTTLVRPLLGFTKKEILEFGRAAKFAFRKDKSNDSVKFVRNRVRLELIPRLQRDFNPRVIEALARIPSIVAGESALISELEEKAWKKVLKKIRGKKAELRRAAFLKCHPALQFRIVERALKMLDSQSGLSFEAWERFRRGLARPCFRCSLPKDIDFELTRKRAMLYKK